MEIIDFIVQFGAWSWILAGIVLLAIELMVPGGFFVWLGVAAISTGVIGLLVPLGWAIEAGVFGVLGLVAIVSWLRFSRHHSATTDSPFLNNRAARYVGESFQLKDAIIGGFGTLLIGEAIWRVTGDDLPAGTKVIVTGYTGATLKVEAKPEAKSDTQ